MSAPKPYHLRDLRRALRVGWQVFRAQPVPSLALGALFAVIGVALLLGLALLGASPLGWVLAGGFLLIGPALLAGFFGLYRRHEGGARSGLGDTLRGFSEAGSGFWVVAGLCAFLFLVWLTDAGLLYAFQVGASPLMQGASGPWDWSDLSPGVRKFALWSGPAGAFLAVGLYLVTAFSIPLLYERRTWVIPAVVASVQAVLGHPIPAFAWALIIVLGVLPSTLIPLLLPLTLPILAYGSFALYRTVFPLGLDPSPSEDAVPEGKSTAGRASARQRHPKPPEEPRSG